MSGDQPLSADSGGNTTFYLYGLGAIAEKTAAWNYALADGLNTQRQLTDVTGEVTFAARYTPWGDTLETYGDGGFTFGYFGGVMDAATGLLYVGNGQYYDPQTGRFLTRDAKPDQSNPYVPFDPLGMLFAPLGLLAIFFSRRKKGSKWGAWLALLLVVMSVGMTLAACKLPEGDVEVTVIATPGSPVGIATATSPNGATVTGTVAVSPDGTPSALSIPCLEPTATPTGTPTPMPSLNRDELRRAGAPNADKAYDLYLAMYNADKTDPKHWWWKGGDGFTIWKFMAILWSYDAVLDIDEVKEAMHNRAKVFCPGECDPSTSEGSLRYLTVFAQSGRDRVKNWQPGTDPVRPGVLDYEPTNIQAGINIVNAIKSSDVDNVNDLPGMAPFDYGNISLHDVYRKMVGNGWVLYSNSKGTTNTFFVLSKCQYYFAHDVIDNKMQFSKELYVSWCGGT